MGDVSLDRLPDGLLVATYQHYNGTDLQGMIYIDYLFHSPSMIAALVLAYCFFSLLWESGEKHISVR